MKNIWIVYWVVVAATVANYLTMVLWSLPKISEAAGGSMPFDMRPSGYSFDDAQAFLIAITDTGRDFYLHTQHLLDAFYPALFAITVAIALVHLLPRYWGWAFGAIAVLAAGFDYLENHAVAAMLSVETDALTQAMVSTANNWTLAKSVGVTLASSALLIALCIKGFAWLRSRSTQAK